MKYITRGEIVIMLFLCLVAFTIWILVKPIHKDGDITIKSIEPTLLSFTCREGYDLIVDTNDPKSWWDDAKKGIHVNGRHLSATSIYCVPAKAK